MGAGDSGPNEGVAAISGKIGVLDAWVKDLKKGSS
jgi:hypothetical protein